MLASLANFLGWKNMVAFVALTTLEHSISMQSFLTRYQLCHPSLLCFQPILLNYASPTSLSLWHIMVIRINKLHLEMYLLLLL